VALRDGDGSGSATHYFVNIQHTYKFVYSVLSKYSSENERG
jgi:hypothetical protein